MDFSVAPAIMLVDVSSPTPNVLTSVVWVQDLKTLVSDTSLVPPGMISYQKIASQGKTPAMSELSINLSRENAPAMLKLFPGIDRRIIDSLSPPALEPDPISAEEYRLNLEQVIIGKKNMPAFDACAVDIAISVPKAITSATGGSVTGAVFRKRFRSLLCSLLRRLSPFRSAGQNEGASSWPTESRIRARFGSISLLDAVFNPANATLHNCIAHTSLNRT